MPGLITSGLLMRYLWYCMDGPGTVSARYPWTNFIPDNDHNESLSTLIPFKTKLTDTVAKPKTERDTASLEIINELANEEE